MSNMILEIKQITLPTVIDLVKSLDINQCNIVKENYVLLQNDFTIPFPKVSGRVEILPITDLYKNDIPKESLEYYYSTIPNDKLDAFIQSDLNVIRHKIQHLFSFAIEKVFQAKPMVVISTKSYIQPSVRSLIDSIIPNDYVYNSYDNMEVFSI